MSLHQTLALRYKLYTDEKVDGYAILFLGQFGGHKNAKNCGPF